MATFQHLHNHSNKPNLDTIDQNLGTADTPTFDQLTITTSGTVNGQALEHSNRANLDSIDQDLATTDTVNFNKIVLDTDQFLPLTITRDATFNAQLVCYNNSGAAAPAAVVFRRSKGTEATPLTVADGDYLGTLKWDAHNGTSFLLAGEIHVESAGAFGGSNASSEMVLQASSTAALIEGIRILADGGIKMPNLKSGTTQALAGAAANELWVDTDDGQTIKRGT